MSATSESTKPSISHEIRTKVEGNCYLCGSQGVPLYENLSDPYFDAPGLWSLKKCPGTNCGLMWLDPAPIAEDIHLAYQSYFTHGAQDGKPSLSTRIRSFCYASYQFLQQIPAAMSGLGAARQKMQQMFLYDLKPGKLLDVGCGDGKFLNLMRGLGWAVDGVDFDSKAIINAKEKYGLNLHCGALEGVNFPKESFDAVTMSHVIEHLPDPLLLLQEVRRILKPGGRLVVTTPNSDGYGHQKFAAYWFGIDPPRHMKIYSPRTLRICAEKLGFREIRTITVATNADIFLGGSFSIRDAPDHRTNAHPQPNPARVAKSIFLQYWQHSQLSKQPNLGEEAVLICNK